MTLVPATLTLLVSVQLALPSLTGVIRDDGTGEALVGAVVWLPFVHRGATTDADGRYVVPMVPPGSQEVEVRALGHARRRLHVLLPAAGALDVSVSLEAVPIPQPTIDVRGRVLRRVPAGRPDASVAADAPRDDPLQAEPDALISLVHADPQVAAQEESPNGLHVRGGASDHAAYTIDGIPVFSPYHAAGLFGAWNPDALDRLSVSTEAPPLGSPDALCGVISATTRVPEDAVHVRGGASTSHASATIDGPVGTSGAGFLVSVRSGYPALLAPREDSYVRGGTGDWLAKVEAPSLRVIATGSDNEMTLSPSSTCEWDNRSTGVEWARANDRVLVWSASESATSWWGSGSARALVRSSHGSSGAFVSRSLTSLRARSALGLRVDVERTRYSAARDSMGAPSLSARTAGPIISAVAEHERRVGRRGAFLTQLAAIAGAGGVRWSPRAHVRWSFRGVTLSAGAARAYQFTQSMRNEESVTGNIFPPELPIGAGAGGVPVARSTSYSTLAEWRPASSVRVDVQAYDARSANLALVAPRESLPFATEGWENGHGTARGASVRASIDRSRLTLTVRSATESVRLTSDVSSYRPSYSVAVKVDGGITYRPGASSSIRLGVVSEMGRRATLVSSGFEWEACNLIDRGCEFLGDPRTSGAPGGARLPAYVRVDLGARKEWRAWGTRLAAFGTVSNLLGRSNVLTYTRDPSTGALSPVDMRPMAPIAVGVECRY